MRTQSSPFVLPSGLLLALAPFLLLTGCIVRSDKGPDQAEHVKISTPMGGLNVRSKDVDASSMGLPAYPGAHLLEKKDDDGNDGSVDLHMGFGPWQMRIKVASYGTDASRDKVMSFYRTALAKYGDVLECKGDHPVGDPTVTQEGLTCNDNGSSTKVTHINVNSDSDIELKAGSKRRQHLVVFKKSSGNENRFALVALELPNVGSEKETN